MRLLAILFLATSCISSRNQSVDQEVAAYIRLYQERTDFEGFLDLYDENMILEDMIGGYYIEGKEQFAEFFNWPDERFEKRTDKTIIVTNTIIEDNKASVQGYFTPFSWNGNEVEAMQFTTLLYFNEERKIIKHVDWINYPNTLIDYSKRPNSNEWIK